MLAACLLSIAVALCAPVARTASSLAGSIVNGSFSSSAGPLQYDVYLPPGYATSGLRYPVIYYLHGLPAGADAYKSFGFVAGAVEQAHLSVIIVAPQGATDTNRDPEYLDAGAGNEWDTALAVELPEVIDANFRTIADRRGRALVGVSAGGYGATLLGLHHLGLFAGIESWSGYFHPTSPDGRTSISSRTWLSAHAFVSTLRRAFTIRPTFLGFYVGSEDRLFRPENVQFARELSAAGVPFYFRMYPAGHQQQLWSAEAAVWLTLLLEHLTPPE